MERGQSSICRNFWEDFKDYQVYLNIHKSRLYQITCRYLMFPCTNIIHQIFSHTNLKMMTLSSVSGMNIGIIWAQDYDDMYEMLKPMTIMETPFNLPSRSDNSRDILKNQVKEIARFRMKTNQIYKTKILRKVYQYLFIFACQLCGQESMETFPQSGVIPLDQLEREGKPCNWSSMFAHQPKEQVMKPRQSPKGMQAEIYMFSYIVDSIYAQEKFPALEWAWTPTETNVNTYCKLLFE